MQENLTILLSIAGAVASTVEVLKNGLLAFDEIPDWLYRLLIAFVAALLGFVGVLITPGALAVFAGTPLADSPIVGAVLLGLPLGVYGARGVHLVFGAVQGLKNFLDAFEMKTRLQALPSASVEVNVAPPQNGEPAASVAQVNVNASPTVSAAPVQAAELKG